MATSDPIADMLTRIRNANAVGARKVNVKRNKACVGIAEALKREGYIVDFVPIEDGTPQGELRLELKYGDRGEKVIQKIARRSKPGCRVYSPWHELPFVLDGLGVTIVSTSKGVLSDRECRDQQVGGELLCTVW